MLGDELHNILYYTSPTLVIKWAQIFGYSYHYSEGKSSQQCMQVSLHTFDNFYIGPHFTSDCGFIKYIFLECEVEEITKSLRRFLNLKAFL
jgi:hypothetical protein